MPPELLSCEAIPSDEQLVSGPHFEIDAVSGLANDSDLRAVLQQDPEEKRLFGSPLYSACQLPAAVMPTTASMLMSPFLM